MNTGKIEGRQKTFAEKVAEGHSATEAYLLAGYRPVKRETAHRAASRLYSNPGIRAYIRELRRNGDELAREETTLTIAKKLAFLARLVLTSSASLREDDPLIQAHRILKDGSTSIRIPCKLKALKMHSELAGHFLPEPTEPPPPVDTLQLLFDQIRSGRFSEPTPHQTGHSDAPSTKENPSEKISQTQQTTTDHVAVPQQRDETWTPASIDEQEHTNTLQRSEKWDQASADEPHAHSFSARKTLAFGPSNPPSPQKYSTVIPTETLPRHIASPPECDGIERGPHWPLTPEEATTPQQRPSTPQTPPPVCKLTTEPLKTSSSSPPPPREPCPLTLARKAMTAHLQKTSPIRHLYGY